MDPDEVAGHLPAIHAAFAKLKADLGAANFPEAARHLFGICLEWGARIEDIYWNEGRDRLSKRSPLVRFFVIRLRGAADPADMVKAPPAAYFLMAFGAFPYVNDLMEKAELGDFVGFDADDNMVFQIRTEGAEGETMLRVAPPGDGWRFDVMPVFYAKDVALDNFIAAEFDGDFDAFLDRYMRDHGLDLDLERAWLPPERPQ